MQKDSQVSVLHEIFGEWSREDLKQVLDDCGSVEDAVTHISSLKDWVSTAKKLKKKKTPAEKKDVKTIKKTDKYVEKHPVDRPRIERKAVPESLESTFENSNTEWGEPRNAFVDKKNIGSQKVDPVAKGTWAKLVKGPDIKPVVEIEEAEQKVTKERIVITFASKTTSGSINAPPGLAKKPDSVSEKYEDEDLLDNFASVQMSDQAPPAAVSFLPEKIHVSPVSQVLQISPVSNMVSQPTIISNSLNLSSTNQGMQSPGNLQTGNSPQPQTANVSAHLLNQPPPGNMIMGNAPGLVSSGLPQILPGMPQQSMYFAPPQNTYPGMDYSTYDPQTQQRQMYYGGHDPAAAQYQAQSVKYPSELASSAPSGMNPVQNISGGYPMYGYYPPYYHPNQYQQQVYPPSQYGAYKPPQQGQGVKGSSPVNAPTQDNSYYAPADFYPGSAYSSESKPYGFPQTQQQQPFIPSQIAEKNATGKEKRMYTPAAVPPQYYNTPQYTYQQQMQMSMGNPGMMYDAPNPNPNNTGRATGSSASGTYWNNNTGAGGNGP